MKTILRTPRTIHIGCLRRRKGKGDKKERGTTLLLRRTERPIAAHSPGHSSGGKFAAVYTFCIFGPSAHKCHALQARNPLMPRGDAPHKARLLLQSAILLSMHHRLPRALPWAIGNNWAFSPCQLLTGAHWCAPVLCLIQTNLRHSRPPLLRRCRPVARQRRGLRPCP